MNEQSNKDLVRKGYNKIAKDYLSTRQLFDIESELKAFIAWLPPQSTVLDIGCGGGIPVAQYLSEQDIKVIGIDVSEKMVKLAQENVPDGTFMQMDIENLFFQPKSFDGIVSTYAIIHIDRKHHYKILNKIYQLLKPNGVILLSLGTTAWEGREDFYGTQMFWSHYDGRTYKKMLKEIGFNLKFAEDRVHNKEHHFWVLATKD